jgi:hypothetical protein
MQSDGNWPCAARFSICPATTSSRHFWRRLIEVSSSLSASNGGTHVMTSAAARRLPSSRGATAILGPGRTLRLGGKGPSSSTRRTPLKPDRLVSLLGVFSDADGRLRPAAAPRSAADGGPTVSRTSHAGCGSDYGNPARRRDRRLALCLALTLDDTKLGASHFQNKQKLLVRGHGEADGCLSSSAQMRWLAPLTAVSANVQRARQHSTPDRPPRSALTGVDWEVIFVWKR